jgi:hypothetical protein
MAIALILLGIKLSNNLVQDEIRGPHDLSPLAREG